MDGVPVTINWIGDEGSWGYDNSVYVTDGAGNTIISRTDVMDNANQTLGIYNIIKCGVCSPPYNLQAEQFNGRLTWNGNAETYNIIISSTELDADALAAYYADNILHPEEGETEYSPQVLNNNVRYYVYVQSDCGDGETSSWANTSFYCYTGETCDYIITGDMYGDSYMPFEYSEWGWYGSHVRITQKGEVIANVYDCFENLSLSLLPDHPATFTWIGSGIYSYEGDGGYPCWFKVTDDEGIVLIEAAELYGDSIFAAVNTCVTGGQGVAIEKQTSASKIIVAPTLSSGFVTVTVQPATSNQQPALLKVMDSRGYVLKSETISGSKRIELNYANGLYFIVVQNGRNVVTEKVILKKQ
jgi:hypothetical protein